MADKPRTTHQPPKVTVRGKDVRLRTIGGVVLLVLAVWFIAANRNTVSVTLWVADVTMRLWVVLAVTLIVGAAIGWLLARRKGNG